MYSRQNGGFYFLKKLLFFLYNASKGHLLLYNYVTKQKHTKEGVLNEELALKKLLTYMKSVYKSLKNQGLNR